MHADCVVCVLGSVNRRPNENTRWFVNWAWRIAFRRSSEFILPKYLFSLSPSPRGCDLWIWKSGGPRLIRSEKYNFQRINCVWIAVNRRLLLVINDGVLVDSNFLRSRFDRKTKRDLKTQKSRWNYSMNVRHFSFSSNFHTAVRTMETPASTKWMRTGTDRKWLAIGGHARNVLV